MKRIMINKKKMILGLLIAVTSIAALLLSYTFINASRMDKQAEGYVGLRLDEARSKAEQDGLTVREINLDSNDGVTDDLQPNRLNLVLENSRVTEAYFDANR